MAQLVEKYECEWKGVVESPERRARFRHFANADDPDDQVVRTVERAQVRPADWVEEAPEPARTGGTPEDRWLWKRVAGLDKLPQDSGLAYRVDGGQLAIFHVASEGTYYASENRCPHKKDMVLARGLVGSHGDEPKIACPLHKKTFSLRTGKGLSDPAYSVKTFPVELREDGVYVKLPPAAEWVTRSPGTGACGGHARALARAAAEAAAGTSGSGDRA
jgi:nitrite reductase (NADH) large subunit